MDMGFWIEEGRNGQGKALDGFNPFPAQRGKEWEVLSVNIKGDHYGHYRNHR